MPLDDHVDTDVVGPLPAVDRVNVPGVQVPPQQVRVGYGYRNQVPAVDRHAGTLLGRAAARPPLQPAPQTDVHNASACIAEVLPELFGPISTTALSSSISTSSKRLKFGS